jgi:hypothetical protein
MLILWTFGEVSNIIFSFEFLLVLVNEDSRLAADYDLEFNFDERVHFLRLWKVMIMMLSCFCFSFQFLEKSSLVKERGLQIMRAKRDLFLATSLQVSDKKSKLNSCLSD